MHDARVFRLCGFFNRASQGQIEAFANGPKQDINELDVAPFIVGNGACPLQEWLLKPHLKIVVLAEDEKCFNKELSKACVSPILDRVRDTPIKDGGGGQKVSPV